jgi:hypothetical protein
MATGFSTSSVGSKTGPPLVRERQLRNVPAVSQ